LTDSNATIVLVHGAWADGSSWSRVIPRLLEKGRRVVAVQLPLTSVEDDLAATNRTLADIEGDIVLVGHSWGGVAITQAGVDPKVKNLVFVSAFAPDVGETGSSVIGEHPAPPALSTTHTSKAGYVYQTSDGMAQNLAPDLPLVEAQVLAVTQKPLAGAAFTQTVVAVAWKSKPSWYVVTTEDRVVSVELQQAFAKRMAARTSELQSSHMSLLSQPGAVAAVIEEAFAALAS
jgi:pimeloyl-ACP methyl ester carboxylesterase